MGLRGIGVLYSFTHGNPGYCLSFIKIITSITLLLPRLQVFVRITPSTPSRASFKRPEGTATTGALRAAGPGARGPRVEMMPLKRFDGLARAGGRILLSTSAPSSPGTRSSPGCPGRRRGSFPFPPPAPAPTAADRAVYASFAFSALNASRTDGEMLPIFSLLHRM